MFDFNQTFIFIFFFQATSVSEVPQLPPPELSEENGSAAVAPEAPAGPPDPPARPPDPASFSVDLAAEFEEKAGLPADFERLWKAAHDNPQDFTSWTDLLQYCEQEVCVGVARRAARFLSTKVNLFTSLDAVR